MDIEYDDAKDAANVEKHGLSLADVTMIDLLTAAVSIDDRGMPRLAFACSSASMASDIVSHSQCAAPSSARSAFGARTTRR